MKILNQSGIRLLARRKIAVSMKSGLSLLRRSDLSVYTVTCKCAEQILMSEKKALKMFVG